MELNTLREAAPAILEASSEAIVTIDISGQITGANNQFKILAEIPDNDPVVGDISVYFPDFKVSAGKFDSADGFEPIKLMRKNGTTNWVLIKTVFIGTQKSGFRTILIHDPDIVRRIVDKLDYIETYDVATGLYNRSSGLAKFEQLQSSGLSGGAFLVKVDMETAAERFDEEISLALQKIAHVLKNMGRHVISSRYSGSEVLCCFVNEQTVSVEDFNLAIFRLNDAMKEATRNVAWISYGEWKANQQSAKELVTELRTKYLLLDDGLKKESFEQSSLPNSYMTFLRTLEEALDQGQLEFFIQPQISSETRQVVSGELLIRWMPTPDTIVPPSQFVDFLEQGEFANRFLVWSIKRAAEILKRIHEETGHWIPLALNVAASQFSQELLIDNLMRVFDKENLSTEILEIELTERVFAESPDEVAHILDILHEKGFKVAIDDFGTGYSSLSYLRRFALDRLKVDRIFVNNIENSEEDRLIVTAIASLAHVLGLEIIAEGVEEPTQANFLKGLGCEYFQGYLTGKPMPVSDFIAFAKGKDETPAYSDEYVDVARVSGRSKEVHWKKSFSTDIVSVDNEHRDLIDALNGLSKQAIDTPGEVDVLAAIDLLGAETINHFTHEETVMQNIGYPRYEMHREKHKWLIADLSKRKAEIAADPENVDFDEILHYLKYWILRHLISEDTHLHRYLNRADGERRT